MACPGCIGQTKVICILNYPNKLFTCCVLFGFPIFQYEGMVYIFFRRTLALRNILQALAEIEYNGYFLLICAMLFCWGSKWLYVHWVLQQENIRLNKKMRPSYHCRCWHDKDMLMRRSLNLGHSAIMTVFCYEQIY